MCCVQILFVQIQISFASGKINPLDLSSRLNAIESNLFVTGYDKTTMSVLVEVPRLRCDESLNRCTLRIAAWKVLLLKPLHLQSMEVHSYKTQFQRVCAIFESDCKLWRSPSSESR